MKHHKLLFFGFYIEKITFGLTEKLPIESILRKEANGFILKSVEIKQENKKI